ncbi:MAG: hypothetical protein ACJAYU_004845 [Bradymonadia bacterium]|jgi:hypothetical protein
MPVCERPELILTNRLESQRSTCVGGLLDCARAAYTICGVFYRISRPFLRGPSESAPVQPNPANSAGVDVRMVTGREVGNQL